MAVRRSSHPLPTLQFIIIGAQKAGTTSLFEYLRTHPQVFMPAQKETSFFLSDYDKGWAWYADLVLRSARADQVCGEASVAYMTGTPDAGLKLPSADPRWATYSTSDLARVIPYRIARTTPHVRLIAVLRDPIERAISAYHMQVLARREGRSVERAVCELLEPDKLESTRRIAGKDGYIVRGEYGRILSGYRDIFPADRLLILFTDELATRPAATLERVFAFIGVSPSHQPPNLGRRYRTGSTRRRLPGVDLSVWHARARAITPLRRGWHMLPQAARDVVSQKYAVVNYRVEVWNRRSAELSPGLSGDLRERLAAHFQPDGELLSSMFGVTPPWLERWSAP